MDGNQNKATGKQPIRIDIDGMSEGPQHREVHHRRALSDTSYRYDDFLLFDPSDLDLSSLDLLPYPSTTNSGATPVQPMSVDSSDDSSSNQNANQGQNPPRPKPINHLRSLSVDSDFFDSLGLTTGDDGGKSAGAVFGGREKRSYHRHSNSMDGATLGSFEVDSGTGDGFSKRSVDRDRLAELALIDPKRAKRILANRQSAARSKERKIRYTNELERKVQTLQTEATTLSAQITMVQRDTNDLNIKNKELKLRLQAMEEEAKLRKALSEALREELQRLKMSAGQMPAGNGNPYGLALPPQFPQHQLPMHQFGGHQTQQQQHQPQQQQQQAQHQQQQQQQQMPQASTNNNQTFGRQTHPNFMNFNQRV